MKRKTIVRLALGVLGLAALVAVFSLGTTQGLRLSLRLAAAALPGTLTVHSVQGGLAGAFTLEGITYRDEEIEVAAEAVSLSWRPASLLHGLLQVRSLAISGLVVRFTRDEDETEAVPPLFLPLPVTLDRASINSLRLYFPGDPDPLLLAGVLLEDVRGRGDRLQVGGLEVSAASGSLKLRGDVQTSGEYPARLTGAYAFSPPGYFPLAGGVGMEGTLSQLAVRMDMATPFPGTLQGTLVDLAGETRWSAELLAGRAGLTEISGEWPEVVLANFRAMGSGTLAEYSLQVETDLAYAHLKDVHATGTVAGNGEGLRIADLRLRRLDALLTGEGQLAWQEGFIWQAAAEGSGIDPGVWLAQWPGRLDFKATASGALKGDAVQAAMELVTLDGMLRDYPLQANGRVALDNDTLRIDDLSLRSAESTLQASGRYADQVDLDFNLQSPDLAALWPGAAGSLQTRGSLRGSRRSPRLQFDLAAAEVALQDTMLATVAATMEGDLAAGGSLAGTAKATGVTVAGYRLDSISADLHGTAEKHQLQADILSSSSSLHLQVKGGVADTGWQGLVAAAELKEQRLGSWRVAEPAPLAISARSLYLKQLCLLGPAASRICLDGSSTAGGPWQAGAAIRDFPLELVPASFPGEGRLQGALTGLVNVEGDSTGIRGGRLELATGEAVMAFAPSGDDRPDKIVWQDNTLQATLADGRLAAELASLLADGSTISASLLLDDFRTAPFSLEHSQLDGGVQFEIRDLQPLAALVYPMIDPDGQLQGSFKLQGAAARPEITGSLALIEGEVRIPPLGISLGEVKMVVDGSFPEFQVALSGASKGRLQGEGRLSLADPHHPVLQLHIRGEGVELARLPALDLLVSPEVDVTLQRDRGAVRGTIRIPEARIAPRDLSGAVSPSPDVVIVDSGQTPARSGWPLAADLLVIAGDNVLVDAFGLRGRVAGRLQVADLPGKPVTGDGILDVAEGTFSVYGRELTIRTGRLLYSGNPIDNPGIEVRAENTAGDITTGIQVTGFLMEPEISFYADPPMEESEIISRLLMNTALLGSAKGDRGFLGSVTSGTKLDAVTSTVKGVKEGLRLDEVKIVTGKTREDLSLVIGTWLAPDLYVSYGKNLLKESGSFNTRYLLGYGFSVQTETGATQSGIDLKYEIDRY
ncbi:MAG: translocation/assembly module TamB domain-containing protein [Desulfobulbaceae bacterium]